MLKREAATLEGVVYTTPEVSVLALPFPRTQFEEEVIISRRVGERVCRESKTVPREW